MDAEFVLRSGVRSGLKRSSPSQSPPRPPSPPPEAAPAPPPPSSPPHPLRPSSPLPPPNSPRAGPPSARAPGIPTAIPALSRPDPLEQPPAALPPDPPLQKPPAEETPAPPGPGPNWSLPRRTTSPSPTPNGSCRGRACKRAAPLHQVALGQVQAARLTTKTSQEPQPPAAAAPPRIPPTAVAARTPSPKASSSKAGGLEEIPKNLKELLATGLLDGQRVKYIMRKGKVKVGRTLKSARVSKSFSLGANTITSPGRITKKDHGFNKLVFMSGVLPEGTDVGYYIGGKRLLDGYIKELGIYCHCCNTVVSPSQFEGHAGRASRRKPYHNIYMSNGVSLHELAISLSKGRKTSDRQSDDLCSICSDGGELLLCDTCPRAFHRECVGLSSVPRGTWCCRYCEAREQREGAFAYNNNARAAGKIDGVDSIKQIFTRSIRIATTPQTAFGGCALCKLHEFGKKKFSARTVLLCDQCGREYHVGCLKEHGMADLTALPEGAWYCSMDCVKIWEALKDLVSRGAEAVPAADADLIKKKREEKGLNEEGDLDVRWRVLRDKSSEDSKLVLSKAVAIFHESFDPIIQATTGRDLIPAMVYGRSVRDQDYTGMYCAVLTVGKTVVSAGLFRVIGIEAAELPLVATSRDNQGLGYFQALFSCIERLLASLGVKHFVLPAADEAVSIWTQRFGFAKITQDELLERLKGGRTTVFHGTSTLHKLVLGTVPEDS
ncbi:hypothetical protein ACQ4PT_054586 [Festuca glaucescens]